MKQVSIILGYHKNCYHCGAPIRLVIIPALSTNGWQPCEDFETLTEDALTLHDCPRHPSKMNGIAKTIHDAATRARNVEPEADQ